MNAGRGRPAYRILSFCTPAAFGRQVTDMQRNLWFRRNMALSRTRRYAWRRHLPHIQRDCAPIFVSISTHRWWELPPPARDIVMESILREDRVRIDLLAAVVMPDHVHLLFCPREDPKG